MAKKPAASAAPKGIDPAAIYVVDLAKSIKVGRRSILPAAGVKLRGDVLALVMADDAEAVNGYKPAPVVGE